MAPFPELTLATAPLTVFDEIEKYAESLPLETFTRSKSILDSRLDLGRVSGIAIYRLGAKVLDGAKPIFIRYRLRVLHHMLRKDPEQWSGEMMRLLLEMQRIDHSDFCRRKAWNLIFYAMDKGGSLQIAQALEVWDREPVSVEMSIFLWQLAACKLSGWTLQPKDFNLRHNVAMRSQCVYGAPRPQQLSSSLIELLLVCINSERPTTHRSFSLEWIVALITDRPMATSANPPTLQSSLATFFGEFAVRDPCKEIRDAGVDVNHLQKLQMMLERYPAAHCLVRYLATAPASVRRANLRTIIDHIMLVIRPTVNNAGGQALMLELYPHLRDRHIGNHTWPFLCFIVLLTWQSPDAVETCVEANLLATLDGIIIRYPNDPMMNNIYQTILTTMSIHSPIVQRTRTFATWRSSYSSEQEFGRISDTFLAAGIPDPAPGSRVRTLSAASTSTSTLPLAHGVIPPMGLAMPEGAFVSSPKPMLRSLDDNKPGEAPISEISGKCIARAESFAQRGDFPAAVCMFSVANTIIALSMRQKMQLGSKRQDAEPEELAYNFCESRIQALCEAHGLPVPQFDALPRRPSVSTSTSPLQFPIPLPPTGVPATGSVQFPVAQPAIPAVSNVQMRYRSPLRQQSIQEVLNESDKLTLLDHSETEKHTKQVQGSVVL